MNKQTWKAVSELQALHQESFLSSWISSNGQKLCSSQCEHCTWFVIITSNLRFASMDSNSSHTVRPMQQGICWLNVHFSNTPAGAHRICVLGTRAQCHCKPNAAAHSLPTWEGWLEHQFVQPHHTRETGPFCNSCHVARSTKQVYNQDLPQNLCGTASKDMGLNEQSFPTRGHPKNINNQRKKTTAELYTLFVLGANSLHHLPCARSQSHQVTLHHTYRMVVDAGGGWNWLRF